MVFDCKIHECNKKQIVKNITYFVFRDVVLGMHLLNESFIRVTAQ